jgi:hypothetical protein
MEYHERLVLAVPHKIYYHYPIIMHSARVTSIIFVKTNVLRQKGEVV